MLKFKYLLMILFLGFLFSCNDENSLLVNPPNIIATVKFRFINLASDKQSRTMSLENMQETQGAYGVSSAAFQPPADTTKLRIKTGLGQEFEQFGLVRYIRNCNYTFIALSRLKDTIGKYPVDTVLNIRTTTAVPDNSTESYLTFLNAMPDSNLSFSLKLGCPNGTALVSHVQYKNYNLQAVTVPQGEVPFTLIKHQRNGALNSEVTVGLYKIKLTAKGQYLLIVHQDMQNNIVLSYVDQFNNSINAMQSLPIDTGSNSYLRTINLSSVELKVTKLFNNTTNGIVDKLQSNKIDSLRKISSCQSMSKDTLEIKPDGLSSFYSLNSFDVSRNYSLIVTDSLTHRAKKAFMVPSHNYYDANNTKAIIRVLNTIPNYEKLTFSLGARYEDPSRNEGRGFSSGISLAKELFYGDLSNVSLVDAGSLPICVFTASDPSRLVYCALGNVESKKSYLLIATSDSKGEIQLTLIEDNVEKSDVQYLEKGVFLQFVNAVPDIDNVKVNLSIDSKRLLESAKVFYTASFGTVVKANGQKIAVNGYEINVDTDTSSRVIVIASGTSSSIDLYSNNFKPILPSFNNKLQFRFVNASIDVPLLNICEQDTSSSPSIDAADYKGFTSYRDESREKKISYYFYNGVTKNYNNKIGDVLLTMGKSYMIIFAGKSSDKCRKEYDKINRIEPNCYSIILQQEF